MQEGIDDNYVCSPVPQFRVNNGISRINVHISVISPDHNDPSARFNNIIAEYQSMGRLTDAIANSFLPQQPNVSLHSVVQIVQDYDEIVEHKGNAQFDRMEFYQHALTLLNQEMNDIAIIIQDQGVMIKVILTTQQARIIECVDNDLV